MFETLILGVILLVGVGLLTYPTFADFWNSYHQAKAVASYAQSVADMSQEEYRQAAIDAVQQLSVDVGIPTKLDKLKEEDLDFLCESAAADACAPGNPKPATLEQFREMFKKLM